MRKGRRSAERLSYWPASGSRALARREPEMPRLFAVNYKIFPMTVRVAISLALVLLIGFSLTTEVQAQGPALTTVSGTVYRADGTTASGTVLISWPSFQSAEGDAVAAGNLSVAIGPLGAFSAQLVPNVGASPAGTYYVEVRYSDKGWGADNNRNLVGRFTSSSFTLTRFARAQDYFLRSYDSSTPPKYSRYSTALHVDYPL